MAAKEIMMTTLMLTIMLNVSAGLMESSGFNTAAGVSPDPGAERAVNNIISNAKDGFSPNAGLGDTLFALFAAGMGVVELFVKGLTAAPRMAANLGAPDWLVFPVFSSMYVISTLALIYVGTGRDL